MRNVRFRKASALFTALALIICLVGTMAYFTDRIESKATITTTSDGVIITPTPDPNVEPDDPDKPPFVDPTPSDPDDDLTNWWAYLNSKANVNFNPGDKMTLNYKLVNESTMAVDIRETFIITSSVPMTEGAPEFALYTACGNGKYGGFEGTALAAPAGATVTTEKLSATQYKYVVKYYTLSGKTETVGSNPVELGRQYYVVFAGGSSNDFQGAKCSVDYVVEAKQHSAGGEADWVVAATGTLNLGNVNLPVVPAK